jgi:hypothetical protein
LAWQIWWQGSASGKVTGDGGKVPNLASWGVASGAGGLGGWGRIEARPARLWGRMIEDKGIFIVFGDQNLGFGLPKHWIWVSKL